MSALGAVQPLEMRVPIVPAVRTPSVTSVREVLSASRDSELRSLFQGSQAVFDEIAAQNFPRWVVTFSGGKDSTLTTILAVDYLLERKQRPKLEIVYSDTLQEIPNMRDAASRMLWFLRRLSKPTGIDIRVHVVVPPLRDRFWVKMIGKGYPPPGPIFRWCTERLKINPSKPLVYTGQRTAVLTGVRFGESANRTGRLNSSCSGGECGQSVWMRQAGRSHEIGYFAPILRWPTCKVWDFLHFVGPDAGWQTAPVYALYGDTNLRFGCWNCSLVTKDRTTEALIQREQSPGLKILRDFREYMISECKKPQHRLMRDGHMGPLSLEFRRELLRKLLVAQQQSGMVLIDPEEIREIHAIWRRDRTAIAAMPRAWCPT